MNTQEKSIINIGVPSFVFLIFLTLKLAGIGQVAYWSWWWVTAPLWIIPALLVAGFILFVICHIWIRKEEKDNGPWKIHNRFRP